MCVCVYECVCGMVWNGYGEIHIPLFFDESVKSYSVVSECKFRKTKLKGNLKSSEISTVAGHP